LCPDKPNILFPAQVEGPRAVISSIQSRIAHGSPLVQAYASAPR
jgi:hypothetical protein